MGYFAGRVVLSAMIAMLTIPASTGVAQRASPDLGTYRYLRQWPASEHWMVMLAQGADDELWCVAGTGSQSPEGLGQFKLGLAVNETATRVFRGDKDETRIGGPVLNLLVDGYAVASLAVRWRGSVEETHAAVSLVLGARARDLLLDLLGAGENLEIGSATTSLSVSLIGFKNERQNLEACLREIGLLNTARRNFQPQRPSRARNRAVGEADRAPPPE